MRFQKRKLPIQKGPARDLASLVNPTLIVPPMAHCWSHSRFHHVFQVNFSGLFEVLAVLLEWTSESHLQKTPTFQDSPQGRLQEQHLDFPSALVHDRCLKVSQSIESCVLWRKRKTTIKKSCFSCTFSVGRTKHFLNPPGWEKHFFDPPGGQKYVTQDVLGKLFPEFQLSWLRS